MDSRVFDPSKVKSTPSRLRGGPPSRLSPAITNDVPSATQPRFLLASITALNSDMLAKEFGDGERQAAARALLRHDTHLDGTHLQTRKPAGLHPSHIAFNSYTTLDEKSFTHEEVVEAALQDLFDAVAVQDRLDGRISLLICCPGSEATPTLLPEHLSVDVYVTPRDLDETPDHIGGDISVLVQDFSEEFAVPHLQRFTERCRIEGVVPPHHSSQINPAVVPHLPAPMAVTGSRIRCSARPAQQFQHDLQANAKSNKVSSSAVREGRSMALTDSNMPPNKIRQHWPANAFWRFSEIFCFLI